MSARIASAYGRAAVTRICARRSREAATSSIALVILAVFRIERMRRRMSAVTACASPSGGVVGGRRYTTTCLLELLDRRRAAP